VADTKITEMVAATSLSSTDLLTVVIDPSGTPVNKKIEYSNLGFALTAHTHATSDIVSGTFADALVAASNVTQHQAALSITESQISDLGTYATQAALDAAMVGLYDHKGGYAADTNTPDLDTSPSGILKGDAYTVSAAGTFFAVALEAGDVLIADQDDPVDAGDWTIVNRNIDSSTFAAASHTHASTDVTDFAEAVDDRVAVLLVEGTGITLTYDDGAGTLTIDSSGGGGGAWGGITGTLSDQTDLQNALDAKGAINNQAWTGTHDFGGAAMELPNSGTPSVSLAGQIAVDTAIADYTGLLTYHDGVEALFVAAVPVANLSTTKHAAVLYDDAANELTMLRVPAPYELNGDTLGGELDGDLIVWDTDHWENLRAGSETYVLTVVSGVPAWAPAAGGVSGYGGLRYGAASSDLTTESQVGFTYAITSGGSVSVSTSTERVTVAATGFYRADVVLHLFKNVSAARDADIVIKKNGSTVETMTVTLSSASGSEYFQITAVMTRFLSLSADDYLEVYVSATGSSGDVQVVSDDSNYIAVQQVA
jgi:hypothetical protein